MGVVLQVVVGLAVVLVAHMASLFDPSFSPVANPFEPVDERIVRGLHSAASIPASCTLLTGDVEGAEDFAFEGDWAYTGLKNGSVVRFSVRDAASNVFRSELVAHTGSRVLGLRFSPLSGHLYFADPRRGLVELDRATGQLTVRVSSAGGVPVSFADHLAFSRDGNTVYLSDASTKYSIDGTGVMDDFLEGRPHGRLLKIDTTTWNATVIASGLYFANGVVLSEDESKLIFSETTAARVSVLDLQTLKVSRLLSAHLIDNLTPAAEKPGFFWASVISRRDSMVDTIAGSALLRRLLRKMPSPEKPYAAGLLLDEQGNVVRAFEDPKGALIRGTSVYASYRGRLFIGCYKEHGIATCPL